MISSLHPAQSGATAGQAQPPEQQTSRGIVARNTFVLMLSQAMGMPLSLLVNFVMGRYLGPEAVGQYWKATIYAGFGFLFAEWGLGGVIPAVVARDRSQAGAVLGNSMLWRIGSAPIVTALVALACFLFVERGMDFQISLALVSLGMAFGLIWRTFGDVVRGFERADVAAYSYVGGQALNAAIVIPIVLIGGKLHAVLLASAVASAIVIVPVWRALRPAGVGAPSIHLQALKKLLAEGNAFLALGVILALRPTIDAFFLSRYVTDEVVGWHAAANRLQGALIYPSSALVGALYPTLCRLWLENKDEFKHTSTAALRACILVVVPLAVGCYVFADLGVALYGKKGFGPTSDNLRVLSGFTFGVYLTMTIGTILAATGKPGNWTIVQLLGCVVPAVGNPVLIPWFQQRSGNGGLGACWTTVGREALMVLIGIAMMPRGIFDRTVARSTAQALLAGAAMVGVARLLSFITPFVVAPIAGAVYLGVLIATGGIEKHQMQALERMIKRKLGRA